VLGQRVFCLYRQKTGPMRKYCSGKGLKHCVGYAVWPIANSATRSYTLASTSSIRCNMSFVLKPWQLLLVALAGWVNLHQQ